MKPDYKNWMPKGMILSFAAGAAASLLLCLLFACTGWVSGTWQTVLTALFAVLAVIFCGLIIWSVLMYRAFDYNGKRQMSRQIIEGVAAYIKLPQGGRCLDVGCGSGALAIAVAKRNPKASVVGIDRWGKEYASFSKALCERNAQAEKVKNTSFEQGDATHLDFPDETFDAVTSNYVYHNIPGDRQQYLLETLRTLKKGGTFAIHDIFSTSKYGDMQAFVKKLKAMGYLLHTMLFLQDALGSIIQVDFLLMGGAKLLPASLPMNGVHLVNDGLDAADVLGESDHVVKLLDPGGVVLGLRNKIIHGSG